jgi:hypothetical protein
MKELLIKPIHFFEELKKALFFFFFLKLGATLDRVLPECIGGVYIFTEYKEYKCWETGPIYSGIFF